MSRSARNAGKALERDLRQILRDESRFPSGAISFVEWAPGGDPGLPDSWIACNGQWEPLELKRGPSILKELRPAQRLWHRTSLKLGIPTYGASIQMSGGTVLIFQLSLDERELTEKVIGEETVDSLQLTVLQQIIITAKRNTACLP